MSEAKNDHSNRKRGYKAAMFGGGGEMIAAGSSCLRMVPHLGPN